MDTDTTINRRLILLSVGIGVLAAAIGTVVAMLLSALLMTFMDVSPVVETALAVISAAIGAFGGGFLAARVHGKQGWLMGLVVGGLILVILLTVGLCLQNDPSVGLWTVKALVWLLCGMIGGVVGVK